MYKTLPATREQEEAIDIFQSQHASFFLKPNFSTKEKSSSKFSDCNRNRKRRSNFNRTW